MAIIMILLRMIALIIMMTDIKIMAIMKIPLYRKATILCHLFGLHGFLTCQPQELRISPYYHCGDQQHEPQYSASILKNRSWPSLWKLSLFLMTREIQGVNMNRFLSQDCEVPIKKVAVSCRYISHKRNLTPNLNMLLTSDQKATVTEIGDKAPLPKGHTPVTFRGN